jgi:hypothetical protein
MPAQQRPWRHDQTTLARLRQDSRQGGKEGAIGWDQRRAPLLPAKHGELMSQHEQLDVLSELAAAVPDQEPQHSGKGEIGERKEHQAMLPSPPSRAAKGEPRSSGLQLTVAKPGAIWCPRARETPKPARLPGRGAPNRHFETPHAL